MAPTATSISAPDGRWQVPQWPAAGSALLVFAVVVGTVSVVTLVAGRGGAVSAPTLERWALAGRRTGPVRLWFLLGGAIFTAYTFVAVPALTYGVGALGFFAVPYTVMVVPIAFVVLPRLWRLSRRHGWTSPADIARSRFGSPALALAVALTGLLATMPYIALQLLGLGSLLTVLGVPAHGLVGDLVLTATFAVLAVGTYRYGLEAPSRIAVVKGVLVFGSLLVVVPVVVGGLGGPSGVAAGAGAALAERPPGTGGLLLDPSLSSAYASLALGSAAALLLYPHVLLCAFAARSADVLRRSVPWLLLWTALLGVVAVLGLAAAAAGVAVPAGHAELALPMLLRDSLPPALAGVALGAVGIAALVPAAIMSVACGAMFASNVYVEYVDRTADVRQQARVARAVSVLVKVGAVLFALALPTQDAITLQLLGGVWVLQTLPAVVLGLYSRRPHRYAVLAGLLVGLVLGTALVVRDGLVAVTTVSLLGADLTVYSAVVALAVNLVVVVVLTPALDAFGVSRGVDSTGVSLRWRGAAPPEWEVTR